MQVLDLLTAIEAHVGQGPIAAVLDAHPFGDPHDELQERIAQGSFPACKLVQRDHVLPRHHQDVLGCYGVDVAERHEIGVFQNDIAGDLPAGDPTEYAVVHDR